MSFIDALRKVFTPATVELPALTPNLPVKVVKVKELKLNPAVGIPPTKKEIRISIALPDDNPNSPPKYLSIFTGEEISPATYISMNRIHYFGTERGGISRRLRDSVKPQIDEKYHAVFEQSLKNMEY